MTGELTSSEIEAVLDFWFGDEPDDRRLADSRQDLWWGGSPEVDARIAPFATLRARLIAAAPGLAPAPPDAHLTRILLVDQFSRALFRGTPAAFEHDPLAQQWCLQGLDAGLDQALPPIRRVFFYLPLEHAESIPLQDRCVALYQRLLEDVPAAHHALYARYVEFAQRHREVIARFGRFPHRNRVLGRETTAEEAGFLLQPGSSF